MRFNAEKVSHMHICILYVHLVLSLMHLLGQVGYIKEIDFMIYSLGAAPTYISYILAYYLLFYESISVHYIADINAIKMSKKVRQNFLSSFYFCQPPRSERNHENNN